MSGGLLEVKVKCEQLHWRVGQYTLVNDELFRWSINDTLMKFITPDKGCAILQNIHIEIYGSHAGVRSLMGKTYRQGFFWLTAVFDADYLVH
jgi:hypothetical protein